MSKIKKFLVLFVALLVSVMFVACTDVSKLGGDTEEPTKTQNPTGQPQTGEPTPQKTGTGQSQQSGDFVIPAGGYDGSEVTITFYHTMGAYLSNVLNEYVKKFNELYPNITISHQQVGGYDDVRNQISTEIAVGGQPNIAYCYPDHVALYNEAGATQALDDLIASTEVITRADNTTEILGLTQEQIDDFIAGYYNEGKQFADGKMYTMPFSKSTEVLYYNKTFFDAHDLKVPQTWAELETLCQQILEIDPNCVPLGYDSEANWFITLCEQYGSPYTSATDAMKFQFVNDTNEAFVKMIRGWYQKGYITTQKLYGSYTSGLFVNTKPGETKSYMSIGSSAGATHQRPEMGDDGYPFEVGIATIPQVNPENPKVISQGPSVCIFAKSNPQEVIASWLFVKYLTTSVDFQATFSTVSGYVPVIKSVTDNAAYARFLASADGGDYIAALSAKVCLEQESAYYTSPAFNGSSTARDQVGLLLSSCISQPWSESEVDAKIHEAFIAALKECAYFS